MTCITFHVARRAQASLNAATVLRGLAVWCTPTLSAAKYLAFLLLVVNSRSWPLNWHVRTFLPVLDLQFRFFLFRLRSLVHSSKKREIEQRDWLERLSPIGNDPFAVTTTYRTWAGFDDCDYNIHLSNSSYAKPRHRAHEMRIAIFPRLPADRRTNATRWYVMSPVKEIMWPPPEHIIIAPVDWARSSNLGGGHIAACGLQRNALTRILHSATHYTYLREIPMLSAYEVRVGVASWDNKWLYLVVRFVTFPNRKDEKPRDTQGKPAPPLRDGIPLPELHTPASGVTTPVPSDAAAALRALTRMPTEPDGAVVNCVSINDIVLKHGRITVPPALALACDGFCTPPREGKAPYSAANPPPHWHHVRAIIDSGGLGAMREFMSGGWRDVPESERWWEHALAGPVEEKRAANYALVGGVRKGMQGAQEILTIA
ncbi:hypothetical protein EW146_g4133 [Bondarzewia mesenterica]|uniref:Thioesterase domain-containing protein n=1 Tax=Bondarzewia mesenterica TaxID=1095465 RepID=A0A4S4LVE3_9AGAM|nr:hypothetical protein EW146_g4133 [Bondarzewia mesenterica]